MFPIMNTLCKRLMLSFLFYISDQRVPSYLKIRLIYEDFSKSENQTVNKKMWGGGDQLVSFKEVTKTLNLSNASVWKEKKNSSQSYYI